MPHTLDETVDAALRDTAADFGDLDPETRMAISRAWLEHAASERAEATSLAHVATIVLDYPAPAELHWITARAVSDELRHAAICHRVARAYDPDSGAFPRPRAFERFDSNLEPRMARALLVLAQCCVQETLAAAYLERAHALATVALPRAALRALLGDEIHHGRIGYAFAAFLGVNDRRALREPLAACIEECREMWRARALALPAVSAAEHGVLDAATIIATVDDALSTLVRPGLRSLSLA